MNEHDDEEYDVLLLLYECRLLQNGFIQVWMRCGDVLSRISHAMIKLRVK